MEENSFLNRESESFPSVVTKEVRSLPSKVKMLEEEISELKKYMHAIDLLQKKPMISGDTIAVGGYWIVATLAVIGMFFKSQIIKGIFLSGG